MEMKQSHRRILSALLALVLLVGLLPLGTLAGETGEKTQVGSVTVIVENNTALPAPGGGYGTWDSDATQWSGERVNTTVPLYADSTAMTCIGAALEGHTVTGLDSGYISEIDGLKNGWMGTLNDWFTAEGFGAYTVANGMLRDGDEIRVMYTVTYGPDVGSVYNSSDKKLSALAVTGGTLNPTFAGAKNAYELVIGDVDSAQVSLTPTAANKNFLVGIFKGAVTLDQAKALGANTWYTGENLLSRGKTFTVEPGDVITLVVGAPNWPSMSNGEYGCYAENVDPQVYTLTVTQTATDNSASFNAFFTGLKDIATVENDETYPMEVDEAENALVSTNGGVSSSVSGITLTFLKTAKLSFQYKASSEIRADFLKLTHNDTVLNSGYSDKANFSGAMTEYKTYTLEVAAGDTLRLEYYKDIRDDANDDRVWVKDFTAALPHQVVFHANDGTETTATQGIFGTGNLTANTFTRAGYRFDGWATTADGAVAYADKGEVDLSKGDMDLYAVWTKVWNVTFPKMPAGTAITVSQGDAELAGDEGTWILPDGTYTYTARRFGYQAVTEGSFTVSGADLAVADTLTALPRQTVTFAITGQAEGTAVTLTVKNSEDTTMEPKAGQTTVYELPAGSYTYSIEAKGYKKIKNQTLTVGDEAQTVNVALEVSYTWDGTTQTPTAVDGVYQITNAQELAGFAKLVNDGNTDISAKLTTDILLNNEGEWTNQWTPIGNTSARAFTGSFDGGSHTISGLYIDGTATCVGLFGYVGQGGRVESLTLSGASVKSTARSNAYAGLVAGSNKGTIQGVRLESSAVSGGFVVGGIAGLNEGTVTGCANESATVTQNTAKDQGVGGVVGQNKGTLSLSYNKAHVIRGHSSTNYAYLGGVVGKQESGGVTENCYNQGEVDLAYYTGGIAGNGSGTLKNCYTTGTVPSNKKALVGSGYPTVTDCFYLDTCGATDTRGTSRTAEEFQTLAASLGGAYENTTTYPILKWQNPNATFSITLVASPARADVALVGVDTPDATVDAEEDTATYVWSGLSKGDYNWSVRCDTADSDDFVAQSGTVTLGVADEAREITLVPKTYEVAFTLTPANATFTLTQDETTLSPREDSKTVYDLTMGTYSYTATAFGYEDSAGTITVAKTDGLEAQTITLTRQASYTLTFTLPEGATVTVSHAIGGLQTPGEDGSYTLVSGEYSYTVKKPGCKTRKATVTLEGEDKTVSVTLDALTPWDGTTVATGFADGDGTSAHPYEIESGEELAYLSRQIAAKDSTLTGSTYYVLTADIDLNGKAFTPIGADYSHTFSGHFDGQNHTISNLEVTGSASYAGLFGYTNAAIGNLTLTGATVTNTAGYTGVLAGYVSGSNTITNCLVKNSSVTGGSNYTGGLVGNCATDVSGCAVADTTVSGTGYCGGLFGTTSKTVKNCYALRVNVTATGDYAGGLTGSGGSGTKVESCFARGTVTGGTDYTGGLIGNGGGNYSKPSITKSYALVDLSASDGTVGTLVGGDYATITATTSFYCADSALPEDGKTNGTGKTLAELKDSTILTSLGSAFAIYAAEDGFINAGLPYLTAAPAIAKILPATLTTPTLTWTDKTLSWTAVDHAQGYRVTISKGETELFNETVTVTSYDFTTLLGLNGSGTYTATVTALGDGENYGDSAGATAETSVTIITGDVTFHVTPSEGDSFPEGREPKIQVTLADGSLLNMENGVARALPVGTYTYTVSAKTYTTQTAEFQVTEEGKTFNLTLVYSTAWDGETTQQPTLTEGVYQITNGYELAWFRDKVNTALSSGNQSCNLNAKLTRDVSLGGHPWTAISPFVSTSEKKGYTGTFDGGNHTISGLNPVGTLSSNKYEGAGLFGYVYTGGTVKDLTVAGTMTAVKYSGGIVAILAGGTVENCVNNMNFTLHADTTDGYAIGGVVGYMTNYTDNSSTVTGCQNLGNITIGEKGRNVGGVVGCASNGTGITNCANQGAVSGGSYTGGVVGNGGVPVTACFNAGTVTATADYTGGIAGFTNKEVASCYNTAAVSGAGTKYGVGGLVGQLHSNYGGKIVSGLNTGAVTATGENVGSLVGARGDKGDTVITRSYYLQGTATQAIGSNAAEGDETTGITEATLHSKGIIGLLGGRFASLAGANVPVLAWQYKNTQWVVTFQPDPEDAVVSVENQTAVEGEPGVYVLGGGSYSYTVSKEDYNSVTDTLEVSGSVAVPVTLAQVTYAVTFDVKTQGATITLKDGEDNILTADPENPSLYHLPKGSYTYEVSKFGFETVSGTVEVTGEAVSVPAITLTGSTTYTLTLTFADETGNTVTPTAVTLTAADGTVVTPNEGTFTYTLPAGTYTCAVKDTAYYNVTKSITVKDKDQTLAVSLETNKTWDGTTQTAVTPNDDGVYEIANAAELAWFASQVNAGNTGYNARLTANIYINYNGSTNTWTPIGSYSKQYTGTFDGNGKTIHGLTATLFGYNGTGSLVKNLTVNGTVTGESNVGGICNASYGRFENCLNRATVQASGQRVGGIVGVLYAGGSMENCGNLGTISTSYTGNAYTSGGSLYLGGLAGMSYGPITASFNGGTVTGGTGYGAVGGIVGEISGAMVTSCYNTGSVTGPSRTGGIVGIANTNASTGVDSCYNVGTVTTVSTSANPFCGGIAGSIANSDGAQVGTVNNCYYLSTSYTCGVGYPTTGTYSATGKTASEMKLDAFAIALGTAFNVDSGSVNGGYPVLTWQGGTTPAVSQDEEDVAADKAALTVTPATVTSAAALSLAETGENGSAITWESSNPSIIANDGTVTLPTDNDVTVTLTATITKGDASDTKTFTIQVKTRAAADLADLEKIKEKLPSVFRVTYDANPVNAASGVEAKLAAAITNAGVTGLTAEDITVTVESTGNVAIPASMTGHLIASDGTVTFYYEAPGTSTVNGDAVVNKVKFKLATASGASVVTEESTVQIPWDEAKVIAAMNEAAKHLTFDTIKGENTESTQVTRDLSLVRSVEGYGWASIEWDSENYDVINITGGESMTNYVGQIIPAEEDTDVTLTATFFFNKNNSEADGYIYTEKTLTVTVPGAKNEYQSTINTALEKFTLESLKYAAGASKGQVIDPNAVTDNVNLPSPTVLGVDGGSNGFKVAYSVETKTRASGDSGVTISGYRANVVRPVGDTGTPVTLKLTITKQSGGVLNSSYTGSKTLDITVAPITLAEINAEIALLDRVKAAYFTGINDGKNVAADAITQDLHSFREAYADASGNLVWVYNIKDDKDVGIVTSELPGYDPFVNDSFWKYKSSNPSVIKHENLLVTCPATENAQVTITSILKSARFADYYEDYKDDKTYGPLFKRLAGEEVTANLTVISTANQQKAAAVVTQIDAIGEVTLGAKSAITAAQTAYNALDTGTRKLVTNYATLESAVRELETLESQIAGYTLAVSGTTTIPVGNTADVTLTIANKDEATYNAYYLLVSYDPAKLTYTGINTDAKVKDDEAGHLTITGYGEARTCGTDAVALTFTGTGIGDAAVTVTQANIDKSANAVGANAPAATVKTATATITIGGYTVDLGEDFTGDGTVAAGGDYTFKAKDSHYDYTVNATMGGEPATVKQNEDGSFTIENVTGNLVIETASKTAKTYTVTVSGTGSDDVSAALSATYGTDYTFTVNKAAGKTYTITVTVGGEAYTPTEGTDGKTYTITGSDVTGDIEITANKSDSQQPPTGNTQITFTGTGASDVKGGTSQSATNGTDFTFEITKADGYDYTVTLGKDTLTAGEDGKTYTIPGSQITGTTLTVNVEKTGHIEVTVSHYITLKEGTNMWLVTASGTVAEGKVLAYDGSPMFWSGKYNAYACLVISSGTKDALEAAAATKLSEAEAEKTTVAYDGDVNKTGVVDVNDAQLTYDMYNANYDSFTQVSMAKFLEADVNGDKLVDVKDAAAIVSAIITNNQT